MVSLGVSGRRASDRPAGSTQAQGDGVFTLLMAKIEKNRDQAKRLDLADIGGTARVRRRGGGSARCKKQEFIVRGCIESIALRYGVNSVDRIKGVSSLTFPSIVPSQIGLPDRNQAP